MDFPTCKVCSKYLWVHKCTAEKCNAPGERHVFHAKTNAAASSYFSIASTGAAVQAARGCACDRCLAEGPHEPMCSVHEEDGGSGTCNCGRSRPA